MPTQTSTRTRSIWHDTQPIVVATQTRTPRPAHADQYRPTTKTQAPAEKEADRWVAQMMFDHYNG